MSGEDPVIPRPQKYEKGSKERILYEKERKKKWEEAVEIRKKLENSVNISELPIVYIELNNSGELQPAYSKTFNKEYYLWQNVKFDKEYAKHFISLHGNEFRILNISSEDENHSMIDFMPKIFYFKKNDNEFLKGYYDKTNLIFYEFGKTDKKSLKEGVPIIGDLGIRKKFVKDENKFILVDPKAYPTNQNSLPETNREKSSLVTLDEGHSETSRHQKKYKSISQEPASSHKTDDTRFLQYLGITGLFLVLIIGGVFGFEFLRR